MTAERVKNYFSCKDRHKKLTRLTFVMFCILTAEKISVIVFESFSNGHFYIDAVETVGFAIDLTLAVLIVAKVRYKFLMIPDFVFLIVKLIAVISGTVLLFKVNKTDFSTKFAAVESITENLLFSLFLIVFFMGEMIKKQMKITMKLPFISIGALLISFFAAIVFETVRIPLHSQLLSYESAVLLLNFFKGFTVEFLLHFAYLLLVLMVFFKPAKQTSHA